MAVHEPWMEEVPLEPHVLRRLRNDAVQSRKSWLLAEHVGDHGGHLAPVEDGLQHLEGGDLRDLWVLGHEVTY